MTVCKPSKAPRKNTQMSFLLAPVLAVNGLETSAFAAKAPEACINKQPAADALIKSRLLKGLFFIALSHVFYGIKFLTALKFRAH
jgi:hypothetical protein